MRNENNYAFIDGNNLHLGTTLVDYWEIDYKKLRIYLLNRFSITKAYYFIGYIPSDKAYLNLYHSLIKAGFILKFKRTKKDQYGNVKGNVDTELVLNTLLKESYFSKAMIIAGDDDYYCLLRYLFSKNKLLRLVTPNISRCPKLFKKSFVRNYMFAISDIKEKIKYKDLPIKK